ncbi:MAG: hypothetical protein JF615_05075, partial [Asticcacaulis sp.]|nr:hypothetical protein [Asticcacaulis sp.]
MNLPKLAGALRTLALTAGLALAAGFIANPAAAADNKVAADPITKGMAAAPGVVAAGKINCDIANAKEVGPTESDVDGKKVKGTIYEIACKTGPGFIITAISETQVKDPFTCNYLQKIKAKFPETPTCTLPENLPEYKWLAPVTLKFLPGCEVTGARLVGSTSTEPLIDRYEVGCKAGAGGVIDYPQLTASGEPDFKSCLVMAESNSACTLTTKEQLIESMKPLATQANANCQVTDVRFVGVSKENDTLFYEFGCATPPGFMVATTSAGAFDRVVPCASAMGLGGCKFTDAGVAAADANGQYSKILKDAGYPCTVKDYNLIGTQEGTKRDYVEFTCPEQPFGLVGFVPQPGSTSATRVTDCFMDQVSRKACTLTTPAVLMKQLDKLIKIAKPDKGCDVKDARYIGESEGVEDGVIVEIACANKRGYIAVVSAD